MASSDIIKIGFDYRSSLAQFEKETNGVFDGISEKAGRQKIVIQLDAKNDKVIEKIKELQKLKLDKFTFEFGDSGIKEQLKTFGQLENKINEIINLSKGLSSVVAKTDFGTKNKTEAYNQLKQMADVFKNFYGNEEAMHTKAGTEAAHAYYKAYEEALRKGVAESKLQKVTVDVDEDGFFNADRVSSTRIQEFSNFEKYGGEATALSIEISSLEERLLKFSNAYSKVKINLGEAPITPEIIQNIEEYVRNLEIAESRAKDADLMGFTKEDIDLYKDSADMYLGFATEDAIKENEKYISSLKEVKEEKEKVDETIGKSSPTSSIDDSKFEELKSDITEVRQELDGVKEKISGIDSEGFESIKSDVERTTESVKELNSELTELKSKVSDASTGNKSNISSGNSYAEKEVKQWKEYNDLVAVGYDRVQKLKKIQESGTVGNNSVYDLLRLNHEAWDEVKANNFFNTIPEEGLKRYTKILEVVENIVKKMLEAKGLTEEQVVKQLSDIKNASSGNFKLNGYDSGWTHFATYTDSNKDKMQKANGITYKVYAAFDDIEDLNKNVIASIMEELTKAGFKGRLKTTSGSTSFGDKLNGLAITDQMVIHGSTKKDQEIAYNTLKKMGLNLSYLGGGIDTPDGSFSQTLQTGNIEKYIKILQKESEVADQTAKSELELSKARNESANTTSTSPIKDVFQGDKIDQVTTSAKELDKTLEQVNIPTDSFDEVLSKLDLAKSELGEIVKITKQSVSDSEGKFHDSYTLKDKRGSTEIYGLSSNTEKGQLLRSNIVQYDSKNAEQDAKALLEVERQLTKETEQQTSAQQKKWKAFQQEQANYEKTVNEVNNAISKTDELLNKLQLHEKLDSQFLGLLDSVDELNSKLKAGEISVSDYNKSVKSLTSEYSKLVTVQQNRDVETYKQNAKVAEQEEKALEKVNKEQQKVADNAKLEEQKRIYKELNDSLDRYATVSKRIASGNALGSDEEEAAKLQERIEELQNEPILSKEQLELSQSKLEKIETTLEDIQKITKETTLDSLQSEIDSFNKDYDNRNIKPTNENRSDEYTQALNKYKDSIEALIVEKERLSKLDNISEEELSHYKELKKTVQENANAFKAMSAAQKGSTDSSRKKEIDKISKYLKENTKLSKEAKQKLQEYINTLKNGGGDVNVEKIHNKFLDVVAAEREAKREGQSWLEIFNTKKLHSFLGQAASMFSFYDLVNLGREGFQTIKEYDNALTEMNKVSKESIEVLKDFQKESFDLSDAIGTTASQIQNSTADFLRLGESFEQAKQSAQDANALFKVAEFDDIGEATEALVAMSQAYKELEKSQINDVLNYTGNNFSISTSELASALQRSAATLKVAGNDIYEATALVTAGNAVLQDAETVGSGLKMISLRILGTEEAKNELDSLGEDVDDFVVQTQSKIDETVRSYTAVASNAFQGISVLDENGNYRSTYEILRDISLVYQEILDADKKAGTNRGQALLEVLAGKNRSNVAASILQSPELLTSVYEETMKNSQGSVEKELESQLQSIETHLNQLKNAWDKLWVNENNREVINFFLDLAKGILEVVDNIGVLNTAFIGIGAGLGIKNLGKTYECTVFKFNCFEYALYA